jgi:hypothetical protein
MCPVLNKLLIGIIVNHVGSLKEGDRVQLVKEVMVWHRERFKRKKIQWVDKM